MSSQSSGENLRRLRLSVDWALKRELDRSELVTMLKQLAAAATPGSDDYQFAHRHLAEINIEQQPWQAALSAKAVLARAPEDDRAWAVLALSFMVLGHYRSAMSAYRKALAIAPTNPWYAHNLGHLLDVAAGRPSDAIPLLSKALRKQPDEPEIASSLAHALGSVGRFEEARTLLRSYMKRGGTDEQRALMTWLDEGASTALGLTAPPRKSRTRSSRDTSSSTRKARQPKASPPN